MGVCNCSMFCCKLLYVPSRFVIILMGKRELIALFGLSSWCLVIVARLLLAVPWVCLQFVIVVFPDHTHFLFSSMSEFSKPVYFRTIQQNRNNNTIKKLKFKIYRKLQFSRFP